MQGEFEKQVQQKMETLRLVPFEPVWQKVELAIRKEKNKRRFLFFLLLFLLTGAAGWWYVNSGSQPSRHPAALSDKNTTINHPNTVIKEALKTTTAYIPGKNHPPIQQGHFPLRRIQKQSLTPTGPMLAANAIAFNKRISILPSKPRQMEVPVRIVPLPPAIQPASPQETSTNEITIQQADTTASRKDSASAEGVKQTSVNTLRGSIQQPMPGKKQASTHWQKMIYIQGGASSFTSRIFSNAAMTFADPSALSSGGRNFSASATATRPALSFGIGAGVVKAITKNWDWSVALQYQYYSTTTNTGPLAIQDTVAKDLNQNIAVTEFYGSNGSSSYTNKIAAIQVNPSIGYRLLNNLPLKLALGLNYGWVVKSTALTYDNTSGIFYLNNHNNRKDLVLMTSSLSYEFGAKTKIILAPVYQYSLTKLQHYNYKSAPHLSFFGLRTGIKF